MFILTLIIFLLILSFLVLVHEFGHFIVAKRNHIHVEEFGMGFPPKIWSKKIHSTIYSINAIPLGGFVKLLGEDEDVNHKNSFSRRSPWVRAKVIIAGVLMNFLLAWILLTIWFWAVPAHLDNKVAVIEVQKNSPAAEAQIKPNDFITKIGDVDVKTSDNLDQFTKIHQGETLPITIQRFNKDITSNITLAKGTEDSLGIAMTDTGGDIAKGPWYMAPIEALQEMAGVVWLSLLFVWKLVLSIFGLAAPISKEAVSGPVGIFAFLYQIITFGWVYVLRFAALISLALGFFNILPFPALDGGRLLFIIGEGFRGKKLVKAEFENAVHWFGFIILLALMAIITYNDIVKWIIHK